MNTAEIYDKVYFQESYKEQFEAFRQHYRERTQQALQGRKIDHAPVSNIDSIVYLHDDPNGGVCISTGDFMEYFNRRFGDNDRIGAARRSLANAARKAEVCRDMDKKRQQAVKKKEEKAFAPRSAKLRFSFVQMLFALMMVLAIGLWGGSTLYLKNTESYVLSVEEKQASLQMNRDEIKSDYLSSGTQTQQGSEISVFMNMGAADEIEIYEVAEDSFSSAVLNIFANIGKMD